jgi:hypothetical protein
MIAVLRSMLDQAVKSAEIAKGNEKLKRELEEWHMFARIVRQASKVD